MIQPSPAERVAGPAWAGEILARLQADPRHAKGMRGIGQWGDLPLLAAPEPVRWRGAEAHAGRVYLSSGTTGEPKRIAFSERDWRELVACRAHGLAALGVTRESRAVVVTPFAPWFSGDNLSEALSRLGAMVFCAGAYRPHLPNALSLLHTLGADTLITLPSTAMALLHLLEEGRRLGVLPCRTPLRRVILVGESAPVTLRTILERELGATTHMLFAASEAVIGYEAPGRPGHYLWDPHWVHLEVRRDDGIVAAAGEGELLVSRRWSEADPVVRRPLGDRVRLTPAEADGPGAFTYLHRQGRAFRLPAGVTVDFPLLERFLAKVRPAVSTLLVEAHHRAGGQSGLTLTLDRLPADHTPYTLAEAFTGLSLDVADVVAAGFVTLRVVVDSTLGMAGGKAIQVRERGAWD